MNVRKPRFQRSAFFVSLIADGICKERLNLSLQAALAASPFFLLLLSGPPVAAQVTVLLGLLARLLLAL
jgi:hypothetical protein